VTAALCTTPDLSVSGAPVGVTMGDQTIAELTFTNLSDSPCEITGAPQIEVQGQDGNVLLTGTIAPNGPYGNYEATDLTITPDQSVLSFLAYSHARNALTPAPLR